MFVLGLQGSPRKGGNTDTFLTAFMKKAEETGASVKIIQVARSGITPCRGCGYCEKHGTCVITDDPMAREIYGLMREADVIVAASPVYFYGISAQLKGLIDRSQALWSRKYVYKMKDPLAATRKGILFSVAASEGRQLFDGIHLTAKYFFDAIDADFSHTMTYRGVESKGAIAGHKDLESDIDDAVHKIIVPLLDRKTILFISKHGSCRAPMAAAMAQRQFGDRIRTVFAALSPASELAEPMLRNLENEGLDMGYRQARTVEEALGGVTPDLTITVGEGFEKKKVPGKKTIHWPLFECMVPDEKMSDKEMMDRLFQEITDYLQLIMKYFNDKHYNDKESTQWPNPMKCTNARP